MYHSRPAVSKAFLKSVGVFPKKRNKRNRRNSNRELRARLVQEDPYCYYCGCQLTLEDSTLDHAVPRSKGGPDHYSNVVLACYECNQDKGDKIIIVWGKQ